MKACLKAEQTMLPEVVHDMLNRSRTHRPISEVPDPALEGDGPVRGHGDPRPRVVDEERRVLAVDLVVVLRDLVVRTPDAAWELKEGKVERTSKVSVVRWLGDGFHIFEKMRYHKSYIAVRRNFYTS